jgi:hypothetical protein
MVTGMTWSTIFYNPVKRPSSLQASPPVKIGPVNKNMFGYSSSHHAINTVLPHVTHLATSQPRITIFNFPASATTEQSDLHTWADFR